MRHWKRILVLATTVLAFVSARPDQVTAQTVGSGTNLSNGSNGATTSLQKAILNSIDQRKAEGLPTPSGVTFSYVPRTTPPLLGPQEGGAQQSQPIIVEAKTILKFDGPEQAGSSAWRALVVKGDLPPGAQGTIQPGDYTEMIRQKAQEQVPGIWDLYEFGHEPRTYTLTETFTLHGGTIPSGTLSPGTASFTDQFVMGFTVVGPNVDYLLTSSLTIETPLGDVDVYKFKAGVKLDWGLGLRLPMELSLLSDSPYLEGSTYNPTSTARGLDFTASEFSAAGVPAEDGNEWVMRFEFFIGVALEVLGADVIDYNIDVDEDKSTSFPTPFGPGAFFPIPPLNIPLYGEDFGVASLDVGFQLTPHLGSEKFTADWQVTGATSEASGSGGLTYTDPAVPVTLVDVKAIDGPGSADFQIDNMRYYFDQLLLDLGIIITLGIDVEIYSDDITFVIPVTDFDLSVLTGGLSVGAHDGTAGSLLGSVNIDNVPPTAAIDKSGATLIHGIPTFLGETGTPLSFTGSSHDPGRDDLTLSWDWGDGAPAPDVVTTHAVPHDVTETQTHAFDKSCLFSIGFRSVDDDQASAEDHVNVLIFSSTRTRARLDGYWQELMAGNGSGDIDAGTLGCMLGLVGYLSSVFDEVRDASTPAAAYDVLQLAQNSGSMREQFDRELLVTWLNLANGVFGWDELLDTNGDNVADSPFSAMIAAVEAVRLNPGSTDAAFKTQKDFLHQLNITRVGKAFAKREGSGEGSSGASRKAFEGIRAASSPGHSVEISFALAVAGPAKLEIYDVGGRVIRTFDGTGNAGVNALHWDGGTDSGPAAGSGIYFLRMVLDGQVSRGKAVLLH